VARFVTGRLLQMVLTLLAASLIVFSLVRLSGDPVDLIAPDGATEKDRAEMRASLGLDRSLPAQYLSFIKGFAVGDLGDSIRARVPVTDLIADRVGATFALAGVAIGVAFLIAVPAGVVAARRRGTLVDTFARGFAVLGQATPPFWLGQVLVVLLAVQLGLFPTSGWNEPTAIVLPAITLGWWAVAGIMRLTRSSMLDVLSTDYIKFAKVKGVPTRRVVWRHGFRNAVLPVVTFSSMLFVTMLSGTVVVETVFAWPGLGTLLIRSVEGRDYPVVQALVLGGAALFIVMNFFVDVLYAVLDPRIRVAS
jgi:peptide/nickel transport system permease protein